MEGGDPHLGHDLGDAAIHGPLVVAVCGLVSEACVDDLLFSQHLNNLEDHVRGDGVCAVPEQATNLGRFDKEKYV